MFLINYVDRLSFLAMTCDNTHEECKGKVANLM